MPKEIFCELLPPGINNVKDLINIPNKSGAFSQASNALKENSSVLEEGKFSQETRKKLINGGFEIYQLQGISLRDLEQKRLKSMGAHFSLYGVRECSFTLNTSRKSEVAFKPQNWILPETKDKDFYAGSVLTRDFAHKIKKDLEIVDIEAIIGAAVDYIDLIIQHFDKTSEYLLIQNKGLKSFEVQCIDTPTFVGEFEYYLGGGFGYRKVEEYAYISAHFNPDYTPKNIERYLKAQKSDSYEIEIEHHCRCHPHYNAGIAPLIIPKQTL